MNDNGVTWVVRGIGNFVYVVAMLACECMIDTKEIRKKYASPLMNIYFAMKVGHNNRSLVNPRETMSNL